MTTGTRSDPITLYELFTTDRIFRMPLFQREYEWATDKELLDLWDNIRRIDQEAESSFLGALVLQTEREGTSTNSPIITVIDGQQRITSFYTILVAIAVYAESKGWTDLAADIVSQYLLLQKSSEKNLPKVRPTPLDNSQLNSVMSKITSVDVQLLPKLGKENGRLEESFEFALQNIERHLTEVGGQDSEDALRHLMEVILDKLEFIEILLSQHHDANEVFDRLNTVGRRLRVIDLARNEVFQRVSNDEKLATNLFDKKWQPFEESLTNHLGGFDPKEKEKVEDDFFFPYALIHDHTIPKNRLFEKLRLAWSEYSDAASDPYNQAQVIIDDMQDYVEPYLAIAAEQKPNNISDDVWETIRKLHQAGVPSVTYPYIVKLIRENIAGKTSDANCIRILKFIESFLIRRALLGFEPTGLHAVFKQLWSKAKDDVDKVSKNIQTKTIKMPSDKEVLDQTISGDLYNRRVAKYVVLQYEWSLQEQKIEPAASLPECTIDHVLPQSMAGDWSKSVSENEHKELVHSWGNLVPMSQTSNSLKSTKSFQEAKEILSNETQFMSVQEIFDSSNVWNAKKIKARSKKLAQWATERWKIKI